MRNFFKFILIILGIFLIFVAIMWFLMGWQLRDIDVNNPPQFIQADFIELDKVAAITKFRSGWGHSYTGNDETCRSMKHEFVWKRLPGLSEYQKKELALRDSGVVINDEVIAELKRSITHDKNSPTANFYSPVDGKVTEIGESSGVGNLIAIKPDKAPGYRVRMYHVWIEPDIKVGSRLKAGQMIGKSYLDVGWGDISIRYNYIRGVRVISYFQAIPDNVFEKYKARGVKSRDDLIISKDYRDAHPLRCLDNKPVTPDYAERYFDSPEGYKENVFDLN